MSYLGQQVKQTYPTNLAIGGEHLGQVPLFQVQWWHTRSAIPQGYVPADGQELSQTLYPDANDGIQANNVPLIDEATWQSTPTERGKWVATSSTGNFRVPDYNGKSAGSLGAVFLRGDGTLSAAVAGVIQRSANKSHAHDLYFADDDTSYATTSGSGVIGGTTGRRGDTTPAHIIGSIKSEGSTEAHPLNVTGCFIIKLFGAVTNVGAADAAQLATEFANHATILQKAYTKDNAVGTVSQLNGAATGAVIERGSNSNGEYVKYADGTQICWFRASTTVDIATAFGGGYICAAQLWTYPVKFIALPQVLLSGRGASKGTWPLWDGAATGSTQYYQFSLLSSTAVAMSTDLLAIGRWY